jgi:hypothetical protein
MGNSGLLWFFALLISSIGLCDLGIFLGRERPMVLSLLLIALSALLLWLVLTLQPVEPPSGVRPLPAQYLMVFCVLAYLMVIFWCAILTIGGRMPTRECLLKAAAVAYVVAFLALFPYAFYSSFNYAVGLAWISFSIIPVAMIWERGFTPRTGSGSDFWGKRARLADTVISIACTILIPSTIAVPFLFLASGY